MKMFYVKIKKNDEINRVRFASSLESAINRAKEFVKDLEFGSIKNGEWDNAEIFIVESFNYEGTHQQCSNAKPHLPHIIKTDRRFPNHQYFCHGVEGAGFKRVFHRDGSIYWTALFKAIGTDILWKDNVKKLYTEYKKI